MLWTMRTLSSSALANSGFYSNDNCNDNNNNDYNNNYNNNLEQIIYHWIYYFAVEKGRNILVSQLLFWAQSIARGYIRAEYDF